MKLNKSRAGNDGGFIEMKGESATARVWEAALLQSQENASRRY